MGEGEREKIRREEEEGRKEEEKEKKSGMELILVSLELV